ncbi:sensor domain-containing protein [Mycobacterium shigaense]|nr:sensor domain-containing protein [Mycobacterium shigaense]
MSASPGSSRIWAAPATLSYAPLGKQQQEGHSIMRQLTAAVAIAAIGILVASCGDNDEKKGSPSSSSSSTTSATPSKTPLAEVSLPNLLLSPAEIDTLLGVTGSKKDKSIDALKTDNPADVFPKSYKFPDECLFITGAAESSIYAGSGNTAVKGEHDVAPLPPGSNDSDPEVTQALVLFGSADQANTFFTTSTQRWPACANRQDTVPAEGDSPALTWKVGPVNNSNGVLSATSDISATKNGQSFSQSCQRALTVRNNVVIDTEACKQNVGDIAVNVANQLAGKVDKQ